jgi:hypothetical protein
LTSKRSLQDRNFFAAKQKKYLDIASTCNSITEHEDYNDVVISGILTDLKVWQAKKKRLLG